MAGLTLEVLKDQDSIAAAYDPRSVYGSWVDYGYFHNLAKSAAMCGDFYANVADCDILVARYENGLIAGRAVIWHNVTVLYPDLHAVTVDLMDRPECHDSDTRQLFFEYDMNMWYVENDMKLWIPDVNERRFQRYDDDLSITAKLKPCASYRGSYPSCIPTYFDRLNATDTGLFIGRNCTCVTGGYADISCGYLFEREEVCPRCCARMPHHLSICEKCKHDSSWFTKVSTFFGNVCSVEDGIQTEWGLVPKDALQEDGTLSEATKNAIMFYRFRRSIDD